MGLELTLLQWVNRLNGLDQQKPHFLKIKAKATEIKAPINKLILSNITVVQTFGTIGFSSKSYLLGHGNVSFSEKVILN